MTVTRAIDVATMGKIITTENPIGWSSASGQGKLAPSVSLSAGEWAIAQWGSVDLGDRRLDRRAVQVGTAITEDPAGSLPRQMDGDRAALDGAYRLINHPGVSLDRLSRP